MKRVGLILGLVIIYAVAIVFAGGCGETASPEEEAEMDAVESELEQALLEDEDEGDMDKEIAEVEDEKEEEDPAPAPAEPQDPMLSADPDSEDVEMDAPDGWQIYADSSLGLALIYPDHWIYDQPNEYTVIFSGPEGGEDYFSTVSLQNVATTSIGGIHEDVQSAYEDYREQLEAGGGSILAAIGGAEQPVGSREKVLYNVNISYTLDGEDYGQWSEIFERDGNIIHQFSYTAPLDIYGDYSDIAEKMRESLELINY